MKVAFRDEGGYVEVEVTEYPSVDFVNGVAYITDDDGNDYMIPAKELVWIA